MTSVGKVQLLKQKAHQTSIIDGSIDPPRKKRVIDLSNWLEKKTLEKANIFNLHPNS